MSKQDIKYTDIDKVGMELFRKNNTSYIKSDLSEIMQRIFVTANISSGITECNGEHYMKSGVIPGRIYYIYSDQLYEKNSNKNYDVVTLNDEDCIWLYSKNIINNIDSHPGNTIFELYDTLIDVFKSCNYYTTKHNFIYTENNILKYVMSIRLMTFLNEEYGVLDIDKFKKELSKCIYRNTKFNYDDNAIMAFIDDVIDNNSEVDYFSKRKYLDSYNLIFTTKPL